MRKSHPTRPYRKSDFSKKVDQLTRMLEVDIPKTLAELRAIIAEKRQQENSGRVRARKNKPAAAGGRKSNRSARRPRRS